VSFRKQVLRSLNQVIPGIASDQDALEKPTQAKENLADMNAALRETNIELLETLGAVVDSLSPNTLNHSTQVAIYALYIAREMALPEDEQERIFKAALVHDVGMISLSSAAISKENRLTGEEVESLRLHPTISAEIIGRIHQLRDLATLVHYHHERFDGTGYPDRLIGEEIPLGARIIAIADTLDAMLTDRPGWPGHPLHEVITEMKQCSGLQFDPEVVRAFLRLARRQGASLFTCSSSHAHQDMLLTTVGISSGRATRALHKQEEE
jgi:HD-GYP domain-containing protein (c-di-GMP phosphodiesterase class II)